MILNRLGKKAKIAPLILPYFPPHDLYIELFAGTASMFFAKPLASNNILNDIDEDIYNMWQVVKFRKEELIAELEFLPIHEKLWKDYKGVKSEDDVFRCALFLMYSNFGYMGKPRTLKLEIGNRKEILIKNIEQVIHRLKNVIFTCSDFRGVLPKIAFRRKLEKNRAFIYADPPYLSTANNYSHSFTEQDTIDLFDVLVNSGMKFALSEFRHPLVLELAKKHNLNTHIIGERLNMKNRRTEILITNYANSQTSLL